MDKLVSDIVEICNPNQIYLFGSVAKGTNHAGSDRDLLIVVDDAVDVETLYARLAKLDLLKGNDLVIRNASEFEANKSDISKIDLVVNLQGKLIYQNLGWE